MSKHEATPEIHHDDIPRFEPWLGVMGTAFIPVAASIYFASLLVPLLATTAALFVAGLVMLRVQTRRRQEGG